MRHGVAINMLIARKWCMRADPGRAFTQLIILTLQKVKTRVRCNRKSLQYDCTLFIKALGDVKAKVTIVTKSRSVLPNISLLLNL